MQHGPGGSGDEPAVAEAPDTSPGGYGGSPATGAAPVRGLVRSRLVGVFTELPGPKRTGVVVAPAGSGKTTLLCHLAAECTGPVRWLTCERRDAAPAVLLARLAELLGDLFPAGAGPGADELVGALEEGHHEPALLVIDDAYVLGEGPSAELLGRLLSPAVPGLSVLAASREALPVDLSRLRLSGNLVEVGPDDLRFRAWEVEALLRDVYGEPLGPEDVARLARRTQGWAACLQLFHLATRGKGVTERRAVLGTLDHRSRLVREFLTRNVLDELPAHLRDFLVRTSVLQRPTGPLCDALLDSTGSGQHLEELERRQLFTFRLDGEVVYRYHQVLRSYCLAELIERRGEAEVAAVFRRAGELMEAAGDVEGAFEAYVAAGDRSDALRLLDQQGDALVASASTLLDVLPRAWVEADPWLGLAHARQLVASGQLEQAAAVYQRTAAGAPPSAAGLVERERRAVALWTSAEPPRPADQHDWPGLLRAAFHRDPADAAERLAALPGPAARLAEAVALGLAGHRQAAREALAAAVAAPDASPWTAAVGHVLSSLERLWDPTSAPAPMMLVVDGVDAPALVRLSQAVATVSDPDHERAEALILQLRGAARRDGDLWGDALLAVVGALGAWRRHHPGAPRQLAAAAARLAALGAPVLGAWVLGLAVLAAPSDAGAEEYRGRALAAARGAGIPVLLGVLEAHAGAPAAGPDMYLPPIPGTTPAPGPDPEPAALSPATLSPAALSPAALSPAALSGAGAVTGTTVDLRVIEQSSPPNGPITVRCFGVFELCVGGSPVDLGTLRPRTHALLRLLAAYGGRPVHRDLLCEALWPRTDAVSALRNVQVAVSALRQTLSRALGRDIPVVRREGERYALDLGPGVHYDVAAFEAARERARSAVALGQASVALEALEEALSLQPEVLLAAAGSVDWVIERRDRLAEDAVWAASELSRRLLDMGMASAAAEACERGLRIDRYRDELWRRLVSAADRAGDQAEAVRFRLRYEEILSELGLAGAGAAASGPG